MEGAEFDTGLHHPVSDEEWAELGRRNASRVQQMIKGMGEQYLCHPANQVQRIHTTENGVLTRGLFACSE